MIPRLQGDKNAGRRGGWALPFLMCTVTLAFFPVLSEAAAAGSDEDGATYTVQGKEIPKDLALDVWAEAPMLASPVGIDVDDQGTVYVTRTVRRKSSDLDIRQHWDWKVADLSFESVEEKREFFKQTLSPERSDQNDDWLQDRNGDGSHDWRDLTVESEKIYRIRDTDRDGKADASNVFAEGFNSEVAGVAGGVLAHDGAVYVTCNPALWKLRDTDGDGKADEREALSYGYGVHIAFAGHNMSGPIVGPDGKIYWAIGDQGVNAVGQDGKRWKYPHQGAVMRCNPDGSDFEVFAHGLRNPQEIAFDSHGNLFSVDNDSDEPGDHERIVYITRGSDSGWRIHWQFGTTAYNPWMDEGLYKEPFKGQPAYITPPVKLYRNGPAGFAFDPGTALSDRWRDYFFASFFNGSASSSFIMGFQLKQEGATFAFDGDRRVVDEIAATGLAFGPDGALYIDDWIGGWSPHDQGKVWRLDAPAGAKSKKRRETQELLSSDFGAKSLPSLRTLLAHADQRVRMKSQFELVERGRSGRELLLQAARQAEDRLARLHGIWGIGQVGRRQAEEVQPLVALLEDVDAEVRAQAAKVIGEAEFKPAASALRACLEDPAQRVRFFASEALGKLEDRKAIGPILSVVEEAGPEAPYLRHAAVMGLTGIGDVARLAAQADRDSLAVRLACVVALRRLEAPEVAAYLDDPNPRVVTEAARSIHDDASIPEALSNLAQLLEQEDLPEREALVRRVINANLRVGTSHHARRLARYAARSGAPSAMLREAVWSLGVWPEPPLLDRVEGRYRDLGVRPASPAKEALANVIPELWQSAAEGIRIATVNAVRKLGLQEAVPKLKTIVSSTDEDDALRVQALKALGAVESGESLRGIVQEALKDESEKVRQQAQQMIASIASTGEAAVAALKTTLDEGTVSEKQNALRALGRIDRPEAEGVLDVWLDRLLAGQLDPALELDLIEAVTQMESPALQKQLERFTTDRKDEGPSAPWRSALHGGDPSKGRQIVYRSQSAQCLRCHQIDGRGGDVAPDLSHIASRRDRLYLLESLVRPNTAIAEGYNTVVLKLNSGETVAGTLAGETSSEIVVQTPTGRKRTLAKSKVVSRQEVESSPMPPMVGILSKRQIRDVIAYLATLK